MIENFHLRRRKAARLLVISPSSRVLLFRFVYKDGPLAGSDYWATPGGKLEIGESYEDAAIRELREETGINVSSVGLPVADKEFLWQMSDGEIVICVEKFFVVDVLDETLSNNEWTTSEADIIFQYRWWSEMDLKNGKVEIWPSDIIEILKKVKK